MVNPSYNPTPKTGSQNKISIFVSSKKFRYILFYSSLPLFPGFSFSAADNPITFLQFFMFSHFDHQAKIPKKATYVGSKMMHFSYFFNSSLYIFSWVILCLLF